MAHRQTNQAGVDLVKGSEGWSAVVYACPGGHPTIGWGHKLRPGERFQKPISPAQGLALLARDLGQAEAAVCRLVKVPLTDDQFAALVSFTLNCGADENHNGKAEGLGESTLLRLLNAGDYEGAAAEFGKWVHSNGRRLPGLVTRRAAEAALFRRGIEEAKARYIETRR